MIFINAHIYPKKSVSEVTDLPLTFANRTNLITTLDNSGFDLGRSGSLGIISDRRFILGHNYGVFNHAVYF